MEEEQGCREDGRMGERLKVVEKRKISGLCEG